MSTSLDTTGTPQQQHIQITEGDSFTLVFQIADSDGTAVSLTGLSGAAQVRDRPGGTLLLTLDVSVDQAVAAQPTTGQVTVSVSPTLTGSQIRGVWDLELTDSDVSPTFRKTVVTGAFATLPQVTE